MADLSLAQASSRSNPLVRSARSRVPDVDEVADVAGVGVAVDGDLLGGRVLQRVEDDARGQREGIGRVPGEREHGQHGDDGAEVRDAVELGGGRHPDAGPAGRGGADEVGVVGGQVGDPDGREDELVAGAGLDGHCFLPR